MEEKEFDNDEVILTKSKVNDDTKKNAIYIDSFINYRKFLEYAFAAHCTLNTFFLLDDRYKGKLFDSRAKIQKNCITFGLFYFGLTCINDLIYVLFRKDRSDGIITKFIQYQKKSVSNLKYALYGTKNKEINANKKLQGIQSEKDSSNNRDNPLQKIHSQLIEIEKLEKELKERIKSIPIQDICYTKILNEINVKREKKKILIEKLREYNKSSKNLVLS